MSKKIKIAIADDHTLLRNALAQMLEDNDITVMYQADHGRDLIEYLKEPNEIEVILMDINMPEMNGFEATEWIKDNKPNIKVLALTMSDEERDVIRMLRNGAHGYLLKDTKPQQLKAAIKDVMEYGFYSTEITGKAMLSILKEEDKPIDSALLDLLTEKEFEYIRHACSDLSHKQISEEFGVSPRTVDGYRDAVFAKIGVQSRVGLVIFAIRNKIYVIK